MSNSKEINGLLMVYTGDGKGKTTAALGQLVRSIGWDFKATMFQFIKSTTMNAGEHRAAKKLGLDIRPMGAGFTWNEKDREKAIRLANEQWNNCREAILSGDYQMIIMDEISYPLTLSWIPISDVINTIKQRPSKLHLILTGRDMPRKIIDLADTVTEMTEIKHHYNQGVKAQKGIEF